mgnify:CR=1 FL=1
METKISTDLYENTRLLYELLRADQNYDMIFRPIRVGDQQACLYFINGFVKDEVLEKAAGIFLFSDTGGSASGQRRFDKESDPLRRRPAPDRLVGGDAVRAGRHGLPPD